MLLKIALALTCVLVMANADEDTLENCKCGQGFKADKSNNKIQCVGILLDTIKPCNIPDAPKCECSGKVTGIQTDKDGTWCLNNENGQAKKTACENKDEWDSYATKMAEFEKTLTN